MNLQRSRPNPDDLLVLLAVARAGRYTAAANELGLNHTTIARRISALEAALGGRVLARGAAGWVLTPLGEHATAAAEGVERALGALSPESARLSLGLSSKSFSFFSATPPRMMPVTKPAPATPVGNETTPVAWSTRSASRQVAPSAETRMRKSSSGSSRPNRLGDWSR